MEKPQWIVLLVMGMKSIPRITIPVETSGPEGKPQDLNGKRVRAIYGGMIDIYLSRNIARSIDQS